MQLLQHTSVQQATKCELNNNKRKQRKKNKKVRGKDIDKQACKLATIEGCQNIGPTRTTPATKTKTRH